MNEKTVNIIETWLKWILVSMITFNVVSVIVYGQFYEEGWWAMFVTTAFGTISMITMHAINWILEHI